MAEFGVELQKRGRDFGELASFVVEDMQVAGRLHDDLKVKVLHVDQQVMSLVEWSNDITTNLNDIEARVAIWNSGEKSSLRACEVQPPGQGGIKILAASRLWVSL